MKLYVCPYREIYLIPIPFKQMRRPSRSLLTMWNTSMDEGGSVGGE